MSETGNAQEAARYPLFSLSNAIEVAEATRDSGGANGDVPKASIAHVLKTSDSSGGFLQRLLTARAFGLIEGRGKYRLTQLADQFFFPKEDGAREQALLSFLAAPAVFAELIKKFDGQKVPSPNLLANILQRELSVAESWKERVASNFVKTAQAVGALDGNGFLRYRASRHTMNTNPKPIAPNEISPAERDASSPAAQAPPPAAPKANPVAGRFSMTIPFGETFVYLETPQRDKFDPQLWEMLEAAVRMLKPKT